MDLPIVIIGAGLSGLLTAYRLKESGLKVKVLEARNRSGGRIRTTKGADDTLLEMGATWFGPQHQHLRKLLEELKIPAFEQYMEGTVLFEASPLSPPQAIEIPPQAPSFRMTGGTERLIYELSSRLTKEEIFFNEIVKEIDLKGDNVHIKTVKSSFRGKKVICCVPPALLANSIHVLPSLPEHFLKTARNTHTWMQEAIKAGVVYKTPFWRKRKISALFSNEGPVTEFHDHTNSDNSKFALCGFLHPDYRYLEKEEREEKVISQLKRLLGQPAEEYLSYTESLWQEEEFTAGKTIADFHPHQNNGNSVFQESLYGGRIIVSNSETSPLFGGYMEGAVYSANLAAKKVLESA